MRGGGLWRRHHHSTEFFFFFGGCSLGFAERGVSSGVGRISSGAPVCWGFWA
jgi:hypothetical protein